MMGGRGSHGVACLSELQEGSTESSIHDGCCVEVVLC